MKINEYVIVVLYSQEQKHGIIRLCYYKTENYAMPKIIMQFQIISTSAMLRETEYMKIHNNLGWPDGLVGMQALNNSY